MFSHVFATLRAKNTVNSNVFGGSETQNHGIYDVFCLFTVFFGQHLEKTLVFAEVSPCNKMWFLDPKRTKIYCKLQCFESALRVRGRRGGGGGGGY